MCVIIHLRPNFILPYDLFETACFNNWHGYGIVMKENNRLQVIKDCPTKGNDPQAIYKIIEDNKDIERFVHLRFKTEGDVDISNTQPFCAYYTDKRQVYFMHNGTLYDYKPSPNQQYNFGEPWYTGLEQDPNLEKKAEDSPVPSDTRIFNETRLMPFLNKINGEKGKGDIHDPTLHMIIDKFWGTGNSRGLLISNDQEPFFINPKSWETIKVEGGEFLASNNDYFKELKRGPVFEQRRAKAEEERRNALQVANRNNNINRTAGVIELNSEVFKENYSISEQLEHILEDYDLYDPQGYADLANMTHTEFELLYDKLSKSDMAILFMCLTAAVKTSLEALGDAEGKVEKLQDKNEKATKVIATLKQELAELNRQEAVHVG